jgi:hypothetical protein
VCLYWTHVVYTNPNKYWNNVIFGLWYKKEIQNKVICDICGMYLSLGHLYEPNVLMFHVTDMYAPIWRLHIKNGLVVIGLLLILHPFVYTLRLWTGSLTFKGWRFYWIDYMTSKKPIQVLLSAFKTAVDLTF